MIGTALRTALCLSVALLAACSGPTQSSSHPHAAPKRGVSHARVTKVTAKATYPPFVSEAQAKTDEDAAIRSDIARINESAFGTPGVVTSFRATTEDGLPQFNFVVDQNAWDSVPEDKRLASVKPGGALFEETNRIYRKYHRGRVCLGDSLNNLMLHVLNENGVEVGLDYTVFVASSEC